MIGVLVYIGEVMITFLISTAVCIFVFGDFDK